MFQQSLRLLVGGGGLQMGESAGSSEYGGGFPVIFGKGVRGHVRIERALRIGVDGENFSRVEAAADSFLQLLFLPAHGSGADILLRFSGNLFSHRYNELIFFQSSGLVLMFQTF